MENKVKLQLWRGGTQTYDHKMADFWTLTQTQANQVVNTVSGTLRTDTEQRTVLEGIMLRKPKKEALFVLRLQDLEGLTSKQLFEAAAKITKAAEKRQKEETTAVRNGSTVR